MRLFSYYIDISSKTIEKNLVRPFFYILFLSVCSMVHAGSDRLAYELATRYAPFVDWADLFDLEALAFRETPSWWQSPERFIEARQIGEASLLPLEGLHLALEPGHIGGAWAEWEGRHFRMDDVDFWVKEGDLVMEVARLVQIDLNRLGAQVTLLREGNFPVSSKNFLDAWDVVAAERKRPPEPILQLQLAHAQAIRNRAMRMATVTGELAERARVINEEIQPDAVLSLHINAAPWPAGGVQRLVESDHAHVLIFGCVKASEITMPGHKARLLEKLTNGSGAAEVALGAALGAALVEGTGLPASRYSGNNAVLLDSTKPYLWARNLMLLRLVDCPVVMLEPYIANSWTSYPRIQEALRARHFHEPLLEDDILLEYARAVLIGVRAAYGSQVASEVDVDAQN